MIDDIVVVALTKTLTDGRRAVVTITPAGYTVAHIDGQRPVGHAGPHHAFYRRPDIPEYYTAAIGPLLLTNDEADQITAVYDQLRAARPRNLDNERDALVRTLSVYEQQWSDDHHERMDSGDYADPFVDDDAAEPLIQAAAARLAAFDVAHPDVLARQSARRDAAALRHMLS